MPIIEQQDIFTIDNVTASAAIADLVRMLKNYPPVRVVSTSIAYQGMPPKCTLVAVVETV